MKERLNKKDFLVKLFKNENKNLKRVNNQPISFGNGCVVSKKVFDGNYKIGYMKRDFPSGEYPDSDIEKYLNVSNKSEFIRIN